MRGSNPPPPVKKEPPGQLTGRFLYCRRVLGAAMLSMAVTLRGRSPQIHPALRLLAQLLLQRCIDIEHLLGSYVGNHVNFFELFQRFNHGCNVPDTPAR